MNDMKKFFYLLCIAITVFACQTKTNREVIRHSITPQKVLADLETQFPGEFVVTSRYLMWTSPFSTQETVHILDRQNGKELAQMLHIGQGPDEMLTPFVSMMPNEDLLAFDLNEKKLFILSPDSAVANKSYIVNRYSYENNDIRQMTALDRQQIICMDMKAAQPFLLENYLTKTSYRFGEYPINDSITRFDAFQGSLLYNPANGAFVYTTFAIPYIGVYKQKKGQFSLQKCYSPKLDYSITEGKFHYDGKRRGSYDTTLTKDYIVTIERDRSKDETDEKTVGRDYTKLPHTVFVYDYDATLLKIIDIGVPVLRIASDTKDNTIYAVVADPDFSIVKFNV
jgi:hypothetical protein